MESEYTIHMIPTTTLSGVLPPFIGESPAARTLVSPYRSSMRDFVSRYCSSPERAGLLAGFLEYRRALRGEQIVDGFQWVDGSFIENVESLRGRPPADIDVVTFARRPADVAADEAWAAWVSDHFAACLNPEGIKELYHCHAFFIDLDKCSDFLVRDTSYWYGLFSHQRETALWKGMVELPLASDDDEAAKILEGVFDGQTA
jgi:hypothetical protein